MLVLLLTAVTGAWAEGYYLVGPMTGWVPDAAYKLAANQEAGTEEYMIQVDLTTTSEFKIVYSSDDVNADSWFPDGMGNNYGENGEITADGTYVVYFRPNSDGGDDWFYNCIYVTPYVEPVTQVISDGTYYVLNAYYENPTLMAAGHNWGTQAIVNGKGLDLVVAHLGEGKYSIETRIFNGDTNHFLGSNLFMDSPSYGWTIEGSSTYTISTMDGDVKKYIAVDLNDNLVLTENADDPSAQWAFKYADAWENGVKAESLATLQNATQAAPVDATFLIKCPDFNRSDARNAAAWTMDAANKNLAGGGGDNASNNNGCAESYHSTFTLSQVLADAPAGVYALTAQGFYTGDDGYNKPYFYANDERGYFPQRTGDENSMSAAGASFAAGKYAIDPIFVEVTAAGELTIGAKLENTSDYWCIWDNFQLKYYGTEASVNALKNAALYAEMQEIKAEAEALKAKVTDTDALTGLNNAIAQADAADAESAESIQAAINALDAAIKAGEKSRFFPFTGKAYLIDAESGLFVAAGHDWGSHGIVNEIGLDLTFTANEETNKVTIETGISNGGSDHFLGGNLYMDSQTYEWGLEYQGFTFYISNAEGQYLSLDYNDNLILSDTPHDWILVTPEGVKEQRLNEMTAATATNPVDVTWLLQDPNFNRNDLRVSAWNVEQNGGSYVLGAANPNGNNKNELAANFCAESYHGSFTIKQTVTDAPAGVYALTAQGFYRQDGGSTDAAPQFFANGVNCDVPVMGTLTDHDGNGGDSMGDASVEFTNGNYTIEPFKFLVGEDGNIYVGIWGSSTNQWVMFDNFKLTYYGPAPALTLSDENDNTAVLAANDGEYADVTLGRTLTAGSWNTFAVPFAINDLSAFTAVKELTTSTYNSATETLALEFDNANSIQAGHPYLVKVADNVANPVFKGVLISSTAVPTETTWVDLVPTLGKTTIGADADILLLGANNSLHQPETLPADMRGFRAYLQLKDVAVTARSFSLDLGDDVVTGIITIENEKLTNDGAIYDLQGRRVVTPTKGVYVVNGKKVIIK